MGAREQSADLAGVVAEPGDNLSIVSENERPRGSERLRLLVALVLLAALFWWAARTIDFHRFFATLQEAQARYVVLAGLLAVTVCMLACSVRYWLLTAPLPATRPIRFGELTSVYYASCAAHHLLPAPAAEVLRTVHLNRRYGYSMGALVGSQLVEKVIDALALSLEILAVAVVSTVPAAMSVSLYGFAIAGITGAVLAILVAAYMRKQLEIDRAASPVGLVRGFLARLGEGVGLLHTGRIWIGALAASLVNDLANATTVGLVLMAVGVQLPVASWFIVVLVARLAGLLPSTPGQFGVVEAGLVLALSALGVERSRALAVAVLYHSAHFVPVTLVGLWELKRQWQVTS